MQNLLKQQGAAIIVALFVTALAAAACVAMIARVHTDIHRTELILHSTQGELIAQGSIAWAMDQLINNLKKQKPNQLVDTLPLRSPVNTQEGYAISSLILDAQANFNINNLSDTTYREDFARLLRIVDPRLEEATAHTILLNIIDWITPGSANNQCNETYAKSIPAYRAPHRAMVSISELSLVSGMTPTLFAKLAPFVTALPAKTVINVNTAAPSVLMSLMPTLNNESAKAIVSLRQKQPFTSLDAFLNLDIVHNNNPPKGKITIKSDYFLVKTNVKIGTQTIKLYTLLLRNGQSTKPTVDIVWQTKGTL